MCFIHLKKLVRSPGYVFIAVNDVHLMHRNNLVLCLQSKKTFSSLMFRVFYFESLNQSLVKSPVCVFTVHAEFALLSMVFNFPRHRNTLMLGLLSNMSGRAHSKQIGKIIKSKNNRKHGMGAKSSECNFQRTHMQR